MGAVRSIRESAGYRSRMRRQALEKLTIDGDFRSLTDEQRATYLIGLAESLGLDPAWRPLRFVESDQGTLELYILATACYSLAAVHTLSITESSITEDAEAFHGTAVVVGPDGRMVKRSGSVTKRGKTSQKLCDARMHAETKSQRRAILAWLGIGALDEQEAVDMGGARYVADEDGRLTGDELADAIEEGREPRVTDKQMRFYHGVAGDMEWTETMLVRLLSRHGVEQIGQVGRSADFDAIMRDLTNLALRDEIRDELGGEEAAQ